MKNILVFLIRLYRISIAAFVGGQCRFYPSCSCYAEEAINKKGALKGLALTVKRLLKCHPFYPGGVDFVE